MRSIWKGSLSFGLVNVPVKLYSATENHDVPLHQVHDADGGRIRYKRVCEIDGETVDYEHIQKAYVEGDQTVVLTDDDFAVLPVERSRDIDVVEFVPTSQIDPIMFDKSYYLAPDSKSTKAYVLLMRTLEEAERTAIVKFALRQKTRLAALRVRDGVLTLQTLLWDDEVREARFPELDETPRISEAELTMSRQLVESFASDFQPDQFTDDYQEQLRTLVEAKLEQGDALDTEATFGRETEGGAEVLDLMEALKRSVEKRRGDARAKPTTAPAKKSAPAGAKATAKKTASSAKKTASSAKKTSAKEKKSA
ncbi:Ku protein [Salinibacterium sp. ZJ77]|uniref:non-homologous end joining protein Ku n=1 Tax=Salinibacterium sp. ZJ77 TaxID=2708337 RepID=UPI0014203E3F|nr:Ku protein [Salinibacterium sp. ZJ77]